MPKMMPSMKALTLRFLDELSNMQSNAGCNDFELSEVVPDVEERRALMKKFHEINGDPESFEEDLRCGATFDFVSDFCLTAVIGNWIENNL
jgi:hypothetical protein